MVSQNSPAVSASKVKQLILTRFRDEIAFAPAPEELRRVLNGVLHFAEENSSIGFVAKRATTELYRVVEDPTPRLFIPRALEPIAKRVLDASGYQVKNKAWRLPRLSQPNLQNLKKMQCVDWPLLERIFYSERALVKINADVICPTALVAQVAAAWPDKRIAVLVSGIAEANRIASELRRHVPEAIANHSRKRVPCPSAELALERFRKSNLAFANHERHLCSHPSRLVVTTYDYAYQPPFYADEHDIVFALNAREALGERGRRALEASYNARLLGLLDYRVELSPREQDLAAIHFGFEEVSIPRHGCRERPVVIHWARIWGGCPVSNSADTLTIKRQGLWKHAVRNRRIAMYARGLRERLPVEGEDVRPTDLGEILDNSKVGRGVLILVEGVEHALALARRLPDWALITGPNAVAAGLSEGDQAALKQRKSKRYPEAQFAITTFAGLASVDLDQVAFLIRGDGGVGLPPIAADQLIFQIAKNLNHLMLVDFDDCHSSVLQRRAEIRSEAYESRGWFGVGVALPEGRMLRFLAKKAGRQEL